MGEAVDARPKKTFFLDMFTRDISLEDAILDLIDNAIDALCKTRSIDLSVHYVKNDGVPTPTGAEGYEDVAPAKIGVSFADSGFKIIDNCGGIPYQRAKEEVFLFGRTSTKTNLGLSVYGVGLKRAIFKLGKKITVESRTGEEAWIVEIDVDKWSNIDEWTFPIEKKEIKGNGEDAGTTVTVTDLNPEVKMRFKDGTLGATLKQAVATTYPLFLGKYVSITINEVEVKSQLIAMAESADIESSYLQFKEDDVDVVITTGLAERMSGEWNQERAGWYILCNSRVVVWADKTDLTGWGLIAPQFHTKFRGFIGLVFFFSKDPETLPWTTTKRGLNKESRVYQITTKKMALAARPVLDFLNRISQGYNDQVSQGRAIDQMKPLSLHQVLSKSETAFTVAPRLSNKVTTVSVQYNATMEELGRVRTCLNRPGISASAIGRHAFDYFIEQECP